jgi:hypothetical protein
MKLRMNGAPERTKFIQSLVPKGEVHGAPGRLHLSRGMCGKRTKEERSG